MKSKFNSCLFSKHMIHLIVNDSIYIYIYIYIYTLKYLIKRSLCYNYIFFHFLLQILKWLYYYFYYFKKLYKICTLQSVSETLDWSKKTIFWYELLRSSESVFYSDVCVCVCVYLYIDSWPAMTGYSKCSAAGSRFTTCTDRLRAWQCSNIVAQYVLWKTGNNSDLI